MGAEAEFVMGAGESRFLASLGMTNEYRNDKRIRQIGIYNTIKE
jgi:hypothetical protein